MIVFVHFCMAFVLQPNEQLNLGEHGPTIYSFSQLGGKDNSMDVKFSRQLAWGNWAPKVATSKAPNCFRSSVDKLRDLEATFCFFSPSYNDAHALSNYTAFDNLTPENGVLVPIGLVGQVWKETVHLI
jgi:hypothetical protein